MNFSILARAVALMLFTVFLNVPFTANAQGLAPGAIAFMGFNSDGDDHFAIVLLCDITNQTIYFTDREVNGTSGLEASNVEGTLAWNSGATTIPAGTVVIFSNVDSPNNVGYGVSHGTLTTPDLGFNFAMSGDGILAFIGPDEISPTTFLAGIQNIQNPTSDAGIGFGDTTGLNLTCAAYTITRNTSDDGGAYINGFGNRNSYKDYLLDLKDIDNWNTETSNGSDVLPFDDTPITLACTTPTITGMDQTICSKDSVLLSDLISGSFEGGVMYGSTFGVYGDTITKKVSPSTQTTYFVLDSLADSDCKDTAKIVINVNPSPVVMGRDTAICAGESVDLSTLVSGTLIENLSYGSTFGTYGATNMVTPTTTTTYFVNNVESTNNCSDTTQIVVTVNPKPILNGRDTAVCLGESIDLSTLVSGTLIQDLSYGTVFGTYGPTNLVTPTEMTTYFINNVENTNNCSDTTQLVIAVNPEPVITARDTTINIGDAIDLSLLVNEIATGTIEYGTTVADLNSANNTVSPLINTSYIIRDTVATTKCAGITTLTVMVNNTPVNPGILDPCNCGDPENVKDGTGTVTLFHDYIELSDAGTAQTWRLAMVNGGSVLNKNGSPMAIGASTGEVLTDLGGGRYRLDFWHLPGVGFDATVQRASDGNMQTIAGSCSTTVCFVAEPIPTLSEWGLLILGLLLLNLSIFLIRSKAEILL